MIERAQHELTTPAPSPTTTREAWEEPSLTVLPSLTQLTLATGVGIPGIRDGFGFIEDSRGQGPFA